MTAPATTVEVQFLPMGDGRRGQRLALHHRPLGAPLGNVLYLHPFAEEMNKSRRMAALQARALARAGYAVLQLDLLGCGDSSGEFADATWNQWLDDAVEAAAWLGARDPGPLRLWGLRAGCLLAVEAATRLPGPVDFLFWQPATSGKVVLQQFLRLKLAAGLQGAEAKATMDALRGRLADGLPVEIAGYALAAELAAGLEQAALAPPARPGHLAWLEVSSRDDALLPASLPVVERWRQAGHTVACATAPGPAFWQSVEIEHAPALIDATLALLAPDG